MSADLGGVGVDLVERALDRAGHAHHELGGVRRVPGQRDGVQVAVYIQPRAVLDLANARALGACGRRNGREIIKFRL